MKNKIFATVLLTVISLGVMHSQTLNKAKLDSLLDVLEAKDKGMGSVAIVKNGKVLYNRAIGFSMVNEIGKKPSDVYTKYRIGSITKMFTATMIFQLIEAGKLKLTTTLDHFFPKLPNAKLITIGNLLNHRSGLHNFTDDPDYLTWNTKPKTQAQMLEIIGKSKVDFQPNAEAQYSNSNYLLLGYIIEKITKLSYAKNLTARITSKIGLNSTYAGTKTNPNYNESYSFEYSGSWKQQAETDMTIPGGAGCIVSTPVDLCKFIEALFKLKLVSQSSLVHMKTMTDDYGMGMFQYPFFEKMSYGHSGGIDGFGSMLSYFPEDSIAVSYTSNAQVYGLNDIMIGILKITFNRPYKIPDFVVINLKPEELDKYLGVYSSADLPLKITISRDSTTLVAQATGQSPFALETISKDHFKFDQAGIEMDFNTETNQMTMRQGGGSFLFTKDK